MFGVAIVHVESGTTRQPRALVPPLGGYLPFARRGDTLMKRIGLVVVAALFPLTSTLAFAGEMTPTTPAPPGKMEESTGGGMGTKKEGKSKNMKGDEKKMMKKSMKKQTDGVGMMSEEKKQEGAGMMKTEEKK